MEKTMGRVSGNHRGGNNGKDRLKKDGRRIGREMVMT